MWLGWMVCGPSGNMSSMVRMERREACWGWFGVLGGVLNPLAGVGGGGGGEGEGSMRDNRVKLWERLSG